MENFIQLQKELCLACYMLGEHYEMNLTVNTSKKIVNAKDFKCIFYFPNHIELTITLNALQEKPNIRIQYVNDWYPPKVEKYTIISSKLDDLLEGTFSKERLFVYVDELLNLDLNRLRFAGESILCY